jgi:hypothetical protein
MLFDDYRLWEFARGKSSKYGFSGQLSRALLKFAKMIDAFDKRLPKNLRDVEIISLSDWNDVVESARNVSSLSVGWIERNCSA